MRYNTTTLGIAVAVAFAAGLLVQPAVRYTIAQAHAATAPLTPAVIDLAALKHGDIPTTPNPEMNSKTLVVTENLPSGKACS